MGNYCKGQQNISHQILQFPPPSLTSPLQLKSPAQSIRMGDILRSKSSNTFVPNSYNFNLQVRDSYQPVNVGCTVVANYADGLGLKIGVLGGMETVRVDARNAPIIDHHDPHTDHQILHKFVVKGQGSNMESHYSLKIYPFTTYNDNIFKSGIYQASLYQTLNQYTRSTSHLQQLFTLEKGTPKALVFVFNSYLYSLEDVLVYRRLADMPYSGEEQNYIADQILGKYMMLGRNGILHRDVRPGKIYLADSNNPMYKGYEFQNLQSCRKITQNDLLLAHANSNPNNPSNTHQLLLTTRGVPLYTSATVAGFHERGQAMGIYDPWENDRVGLAKTIAALATLDLEAQSIDYEGVKKKNKELYELIKKLENMSISLDEINRAFALKSSQRSITVLDSDYNICHNLLPTLLRQSHKDRIESSTTQALFSLHLREQFTHRLDKMISQNYKDGASVQNVAVLDRLGRHYEGLGHVGNDYYGEEIGLLVDLAEEARGRGSSTEGFLGQAAEIYGEKFGGRLGNPVTNANYKVETAYQALAKQDPQTAYAIINQAMLQASTNNKIPISTQLKLIQAKGVIETTVNGPEAGNTFLQRGLQLCGQRQNFITQVQQLEYKSNFQHLLGQNLLTTASHKKSTMSPDQLSRLCAQSESMLTAARDTKMEIPTKNPLPLARVYEALGDLAQLREDYHGAAGLYDKGYRLMASAEVEIAEAEKIRILEKMHSHYSNHSQDFSQQQKIKLHLNNLKKPKPPSQRDDRKYFQTIRYKKQQLKSKLFPQRTIPSSLNPQAQLNPITIRNQNQNQIKQAQQFQEEDQSKRVIIQAMPSREGSLPENGGVVSYQQ